MYQVMLWLFVVAALAGGVLMLVLRQPMRVAMALIAVMLSLAAIYAMLGVHVIAVFQVMIYVSAVMVFMVYAIMLMDVRDPSFTHRYSGYLLPGLAGLVALGWVLAYGVGHSHNVLPGTPAGGAFDLQRFSTDFLNEYWLYFELTSVLLLAAVVAAIAILKARRRGNG